MTQTTLNYLKSLKLYTKIPSFNIWILYLRYRNSLFHYTNFITHFTVFFFNPYFFFFFLSHFTKERNFEKIVCRLTIQRQIIWKNQTNNMLTHVNSINIIKKIYTINWILFFLSFYFPFSTYLGSNQTYPYPSTIKIVWFVLFSRS